METIKGFIAFLLILVPLGATIRIVLCLTYAAVSEDPRSYKRKAINALIFSILAECITGIIDLIISYFGGGIVF